MQDNLKFIEINLKASPVEKIIICGLLFCSFISFGQYDNGFPFGKISYAEVEMKSYPKDTAANAVVLNEFGEAYIDSDGDNNLLLEYHIKIIFASTKKQKPGD